LALLSSLLIVASVAPPALAGPASVEYRPIEIGDRFRNEEPARHRIKVHNGEHSARAAAGEAAQSGAGAAGEQKLWLTLTPAGYALTYYTLRGVGKHGEVWVQNDLAFPAGDPRPTPVITDEQVAYLLQEFD